MTDEKIEAPEPLLPTAEPVVPAEAPAAQRWSAAKVLNAFFSNASERFSAVLVLGLSAAALVPPPSARETFAATIPQTKLVQLSVPQPVATLPIQIAEASPRVQKTESSTARPVLKGRPKVTLKDKWAKAKTVTVLRSAKDAPREDLPSAQADDLTIVVAKAPDAQIEARTAKHETELVNSVKPEVAAPAPPLQQQGPAKFWPEETVKSARASCEEVLKKTTVKYSMLEPMREGACGTPAPISLQSVGKTGVSFHPALTINCDTAAALASWIDNQVQPAAQETFGVPVKRLLSASSYSCRNRYGRKDAPLSEHATANAVDVFGFVLSDGRTIKVANAWGPTERDAKVAAAKPAFSDVKIADAAAVRSPKSNSFDVELLPRHPDYKRQQLSKLGAGDVAAAQAKKSTKTPNGPRVLGAAFPAEDKSSQFLKRIHGEACGIFGTVLGPEANNAHRDHLHLDMKSRRKAFCE